MRFLGRPVVWTGAFFIVLTLTMDRLEPLFHWLFPDIARPVYTRASFLELALSHAALAGSASLIAVVFGVGAAIFATRPAGKDFAPTVETLTSIAQTFSPVAVLALAVPSMGYGAAPTLLALILYGLLPVTSAALAGLRGLPPATLEAADGTGFSPLGRLWQIELPMAAPVILSGVRTSTIIGIGTATIGSTVGALTLGSPIIDGLSGSNTAFVIQGTVLVALFAITVDMLFGELARLLPHQEAND